MDLIDPNLGKNFSKAAIKTLNSRQRRFCCDATFDPVTSSGTTGVGSPSRCVNVEDTRAQRVSGEQHVREDLVSEQTEMRIMSSGYDACKHSVNT